MGRGQYPKLRAALGRGGGLYEDHRVTITTSLKKIDTRYPRFGEQYRLPFEYEPANDDGIGIKRNEAAA
jgi:hypothetical protein